MPNVPKDQTSIQKPEPRLGLSRKRMRTERTLFSFIKKPITRGAKIIKIEIYDADNSPNSEKSTCDCEAEICVQHIVKTVMFDDIYNNIKDIITKIQDEIVSC